MKAVVGILNKDANAEDAHKAIVEERTFFCFSVVMVWRTYCHYDKTCSMMLLHVFMEVWFLICVSGAFYFLLTSDNGSAREIGTGVGLCTVIEGRWFHPENSDGFIRRIDHFRQESEDDSRSRLRIDGHGQGWCLGLHYGQWDRQGHLKRWVTTRVKYLSDLAHLSYCQTQFSYSKTNGQCIRERRVDRSN